MEELQLTFKNVGLGEYNDSLFEYPPFDLINKKYTFLLAPGKSTSFWRFGIAIAKDKDFQFEPNKGRYNNDQIRFIELNVGERNQGIWELSNRLQLSTY